VRYLRALFLIQINSPTCDVIQKGRDCPHVPVRGLMLQANQITSSVPEKSGCPSSALPFCYKAAEHLVPTRLASTRWSTNVGPAGGCSNHCFLPVGHNRVGCQFRVDRRRSRSSENYQQWWAATISGTLPR
jgi:hypothetical protein